MNDGVVISSYGLLRVGEHWDKSLRDLIAEASINALEKVEWPPVDKVLIANAASEVLTGQGNISALTADQLGLDVPSVRIEAADASGGLAVHEAYLAVKSGVYKNILVVGAEKVSEHVSAISVHRSSISLDKDYELIYGTPVSSIYALLMKAYMDKFKVSREPFGQFAVEMHKNAVENPYAQLRFPIDIRSYMESPMVSDPLCLLDCSPLGDGAAALIMSSMEYAKKFTDKYVEVAASSAASDALSIMDRDSILEFKATKIASEKAFKIAGLTREKVDFLEIHDVYTVSALITLEDLGYAEKGAAHKYVMERGVSREGELPVNPEGGLKARGHPIGATGIYQIVEATMQLMEEAGSLQLNEPNVSLVQSMGGTGSTVIVNILRKLF